MSSINTANLLRELRQKFNYSCKDIAIIMGVSKAAVSKWEDGDYIRVEHLYELAKLYSVKFSELYNGRLDDEENESVWKRNYDLTNYEINGEINDKNIDQLKIYFEHCKMIKEKFFILLQKWASDEINDSEMKEFEFIKDNYYTFDVNYYYDFTRNILQQTPIIYYPDIEYEFVKDYYKIIESYSDEEKKWEIEKLYNFKNKKYIDEIFDCQNLKAVEYMLLSYSQIEKDNLLYINMYVKMKNGEYRLRKNSEIGRHPFFKIILNSGANYLRMFKGISGAEYDNVLDYVDGKYYLDRVEDYFMQTQLYNIKGSRDMNIFKKWKMISYKKYLEYVDHDRTENLRDIVELREENPIEYYHRLQNRDYRFEKGSE